MMSIEDRYVPEDWDHVEDRYLDEDFDEDLWREVCNELEELRGYTVQC